jgi:hypothetical protein
MINKAASRKLQAAREEVLLVACGLKLEARKKITL